MPGFPTPDCSDDPDEPPEPEPSSECDDDDEIMIDDDTSDDEEFVEWDPTHRYGRYAEVLGRGAAKTVYRGYDLVDCKEVAWNKAVPPASCCSEEQATAVLREVQLLKGLNYKGIIKLYSAWVDPKTRDTNFITELCSSTLLGYRMKHKHVSRKALKSWVRQILSGLAYLHAQSPPIIHRDLKCENIFVKCSGNTTLKIGDFGSAAVLSDTHHLHTVVGTPEFMAPEMFNEDYNELVDVYSFGMCILELLTRECPYSECNSVAQIYKKVTNGTKPKALSKVRDTQALRFINRCLLPVAQRPSARELLSDPFLQGAEVNHDCEGSGAGNHPCALSKAEGNHPCALSKAATNQVKSSLHLMNLDEDPGGQSSLLMNVDEDSCDPYRYTENSLVPGETFAVKRSGDSQAGQLVRCEKNSAPGRSYQVRGVVEDETTVQFKLRIKEMGRFRDVSFPFDLRVDTPESVAEEMVRVLEHPDSDLAIIADLISDELAALLLSSNDASMHGSVDPGTVGASSAVEKTDGSVGSEIAGPPLAAHGAGSSVDLLAEGGAAPEVSSEGYDNEGLDSSTIADKLHSANHQDGQKFCHSPIRNSATVTLNTSGCYGKTMWNSKLDRITPILPQVLSPKTVTPNRNGCSGKSMSYTKSGCLIDGQALISPFQCKQPPAGIGILLEPSCPQGIRRAIPSHVKAFA